jgi:hypothetical protein
VRTKDRLDALDRRFTVNTRWTYDEPRPRWLRLAPAAVAPAIATNLLSDAFAHGSVARTMLQAVTGVLLLGAAVMIVQLLRWQRKHRVRAPQA